MLLAIVEMSSREVEGGKFTPVEEAMEQVRELIRKNRANKPLDDENLDHKH